MNAKVFKTLVKDDHKLGKDNFVFGRIMGAMAVMCKDDPAMGLESGWGHCDNGKIIKTETTVEQYGAFASVIENWYTGLCIFDYVE